MDKLSVSLKPITKEISKAEKKLRAIRPRVSQANKRKIDLEIRDLKKARRIILIWCFIMEFPPKDK